MTIRELTPEQFQENRKARMPLVRNLKAPVRISDIGLTIISVPPRLSYGKVYSRITVKRHCCGKTELLTLRTLLARLVNPEVKLCRSCASVLRTEQFGTHGRGAPKPWTKLEIDWIHEVWKPTGGDYGLDRVW